MPTYATTKELKKMSLRINSQNIRQEIGIQVAFIMGKKLQKEHFLVKKRCHFGDFWVHFEPLLEWECAYVCHD